MAAGDEECVCYICQDLLAEDPEREDDDPVAPPAKRSRSEECESPQAGTSRASMVMMTEGRKEDHVVPELVTTVCGHIFHKWCLLNWIKRKKECPNCRRAKITPKKLTRVFLPLTAGKCKGCKERVKEVEEALLEKVLAKSEVEACLKKEQEWMERFNAAVRSKEELNAKLEKKEEKLEELGAQLLAEKVARALGEREKETQLRVREGQLQREVQQERKKRETGEKREIALRSEVGRLGGENGRLEEALKNQMTEDKTQIEYWKRMYQLKNLEMEKYKKDRDYERDRANFQLEWGTKMKRDSEIIMEGAEEDDNDEHLATSVNTNDTINASSQHADLLQFLAPQRLQDDLQLSESDDDEEENNNDRYIGTVNSDSSSTSSSDDEEGDLYVGNISSAHILPYV